MNQWIKNHFDEDDEVSYFFHRPVGGGAVACVSLEGDKIVFNGYNHQIVIENIGTSRERLVVKNAADLVV